MPWTRTDAMSERVKFIGAYLQDESSFSELCLDFGVSRKTGYKWVARYESAGLNALAERSRAPHSHARALPESLVQAIVAVRRRHPRWGPRKLRVILGRQQPDRVLPAASTIGDVLKRHGLVGKRRRIRRSDPYGEQLRTYATPNAVWCADFKGHFPVGVARCHPLTISDGYSRYLLCCRALRRPKYTLTRPVFEWAFREYGLPEAIRTDNGSPFSTLALGGLSRLAVWWIRLGIRPERIVPGRPDQNGRHERMHRTLKADTARPPRASFLAQQRAFDHFRVEYNEQRPHEALGQNCPATRYHPSTRPYPRQLPEPEYPSHFTVQLAYGDGSIQCGGRRWYLSDCLSRELIGLEACAEDRWRVHFGHVALGVIDLQRAAHLEGQRLGQLVPILNGPMPRRRWGPRPR